MKTSVAAAKPPRSPAETKRLRRVAAIAAVGVARKEFWRTAADCRCRLAAVAEWVRHTERVAAKVGARLDPADLTLALAVPSGRQVETP